MRYLLTFYAVEDEWMNLAESERSAGIADIGDGTSDGPFIEAKESVGSYAVVDVKDEAEAIGIASSWPAGGVVEVRPVAE